MTIKRMLCASDFSPASRPALRLARVNLVVMGTHGRTGVRRLLMGSVADRVIRTASCPVLVVGGRH
jgi:nucleotide-binding universal stress UspA family protein